MGSIFFRLFCHKSDIGDISHGGHIKGSVFFTEINGGLVYPCIVAVWDHCLRVLRVAIRSPHLSGCTNHGRHGGIDNYITGNMQVGDSLIGINHGKWWPFLKYFVEVCTDCGLSLSVQRIQYLIKIRESIIWIETGCTQSLAMLVK